MWKSLYSLFKKDCRMMVSGKFFYMALGSLLFYTLFINFGYLNFMHMEVYDITCELLFIEISAVGFLGIAAVLFKEKQMGVIRVHAIMPFSKSLFVFSKLFLFLVTDLVFATLMILFNIGPGDMGSILPAVLVQTAILSIIMALAGFSCAMLLQDFKQFTLAYPAIVLFAAAPVFLSANTSIKMAWIDYYPFYHLYMGLKNAFFGMPVTSPVYYICAACAIILLSVIAGAVFRNEMGKEG